MPYQSRSMIQQSELIRQFLGGWMWFDWLRIIDVKLQIDNVPNWIGRSPICQSDQWALSIAHASKRGLSIWALSINRHGSNWHWFDEDQRSLIFSKFFILTHFLIFISVISLSWSPSVPHFFKLTSQCSAMTLHAPCKRILNLTFHTLGHCWNISCPLTSPTLTYPPHFSCSSYTSTSDLFFLVNAIFRATFPGWHFH